MTLPDERYAAVLRTKQFLLDLCSPKVYPRVPKEVREQARWCLRHYPDTFDMQQAADAVPYIFTEKMEDLHRFVVKGKK